LAPFRQLAQSLLNSGHTIYLASRDVVAAGEEFAGLPVELFAAPVLPATPPYAISPVRSYVDILHNVGFGSRKHLRALASAWMSIFVAVRPDVVVFDHSPTALAASYAFATRRVLLGTGFACPPPGHENDDMRIWLGELRAKSDPATVLANINALRSVHRLVPLRSVGEMFASADATLLATFPEIDHFGNRAAGEYVGVFPLPDGVKADWPKSQSPRAFAYLKPHPLVEKVVTELTRQRIATVLCTGSDDPKVNRRYETEFVRVRSPVLDLAKLMREADFVVLNGGHATTSAALLMGKPSVQLPLVLEQWVFGERVAQIGAGVLVPANRPERLSDALAQAALGQQTPGAAAFAHRYAAFDRQAALARAAEVVESVATD
jgi:UDP:flavonoid glycosyltransferase YjiC (YdhE family)